MVSEPNTLTNLPELGPALKAEWRAGPALDKYSERRPESCP
jgi:hypothetical protein